MDTLNAIEDSPQSQAARQAIGEAAKPPFIFKQYGLVVRQVAKLLHRHGLGQTLAYIQLRCTGRPNSPLRSAGPATGPLAADRSGGLGPLGACGNRQPG